MKNNMIIPETVQTVCSKLDNQGYKAYVVGGAVRDQFMGITPHDFDITTDAVPSTVAIMFREPEWRVVGIGERFGTMLVIQGGVGLCEVTTFRSDGEYSDSRHPDQVTFSESLDEDLSRRDFTINAIAYNPLTEQYRDPYGGINDITNGIIKTVGVPVDRFTEDPLRMIRFARFKGKFGFNHDDETWRACRNLSHLLLKIPKERIREEILKALSDTRVNAVCDFIDALDYTGMLYFIIPELSRQRFVTQPSEYHKYDVLTHSTLVAELCPPDNVYLRLAGLFHDLGKISMNEEAPYFPGHEVASEALTRKIMQELKFPTVYIEYVCHLVSRHMDCSNYKNYKTERSIRRYLSKFGNTELLPDLFTLQRADINGRGVAREELLTAIAIFESASKDVIVSEPSLTTRDLSVNGHDLMNELGMKPGPLIGEVIEHMLQHVIDHPDDNIKEQLLNIARLYESNKEVEK